MQGKRLSPSESAKLRKEVKHIVQRPDEHLEDFARRTKIMVEDGFPDTPILFQELIAINAFISGSVCRSSLKERIKMRCFNCLHEATEYLRQLKSGEINVDITVPLLSFEIDERENNGPEIDERGDHEHETNENGDDEQDIDEREDNDHELEIDEGGDDKLKIDKLDDNKDAKCQKTEEKNDTEIEENTLVVNKDEKMGGNENHVDKNAHKQIEFITRQKLHRLVYNNITDNKSRYESKKLTPCNTQAIYINNSNQTNVKRENNKHQIQINSCHDQKVKQLAEIVDELAPNLQYNQNKYLTNRLRGRQHLYWSTKEVEEINKKYMSEEIQRESAISNFKYYPELKEQSTQTMQDSEIEDKGSKGEDKATQTIPDIIAETTKTGTKELAYRDNNKKLNGSHTRRSMEKATMKKVKENEMESRLKRKQHEKSQRNKYREKMKDEQLMILRKKNDLVTTPSIKRRLTTARDRLYTTRITAKMRIRKPGTKTMNKF